MGDNCAEATAGLDAVSPNSLHSGRTARIFSIMGKLAWRVWLGLSMGVAAQTAVPSAGNRGHGIPVAIVTADLTGFDALPADRRKLIGIALKLARDFPSLPYTPNSADPAQGGFDCSGAMYYVMRQAGLDPPRTAAEQAQWLRDNERLHEVPAGALGLTHPSLEQLRPGDLLFWGTSESADATAKVTVTHVAMYLGTEKRDGWPVMINSTDGRSYRAAKTNGYAVCDFRLQKAGAKVAFKGYGTPPGISNMQGD